MIIVETETDNVGMPEPDYFVIRRCVLRSYNRGKTDVYLCDKIWFVSFHDHFSRLQAGGVSGSKEGGWKEGGRQ